MGILLLNACNDHHYQPTAEPKLIPFKIENTSALTTEKNFKLTLDSIDHFLFISLDVDLPKSFPFPVNKKYNDTLRNTAFNFDFYYNNNLIHSDYKKIHNEDWSIDSSETANYMSITADTMNLLGFSGIRFHIPFYAFHELKKGKQTIELVVSQKVFTDEVTLHHSAEQKNYDATFHVYAPLSLLSMKIKFEIDMPPIYKSMMYGYGLVLENDSSFSPAGMDNTLWNSSYPDIYWTLEFPVGEFYAKTMYEKSTEEYVGHDTFCLYHYSPKDTIGIGVLDHDNLSRDDVMGFWKGPLERLSKSKVNRITFDHIKSFDAKVENKGVVN